MMEFISNSSLAAAAATAALLLVLLLCYVWLRSGRDQCPSISPPPGPSVWTFVRHIEAAKLAPYRFLLEIGKEYGGFYAFSNYARNFVVINDWKVMKQALIVQSSAFAGRPDMFVANKMLQRKDILFIDGPLWAEKRRFTLHHLRNLGFGRTSMECVILNEISMFSESLERQSMNGPVPIDNLFFPPVMNVLWGVLAGRRYDCEDGEDMQRFCSTITTVFQLFHECVHLNFFPQLRFIFGTGMMSQLLKLSSAVQTFLAKEIERNRRELREDDPNSFFDLYLSEIIKEEKSKLGDKKNYRNCYTEADLIGISFDLLQAGIETTVSTLEWTMLYMALWPEIQETVQEELDRVVGRHREPIFADHANLPFLEATILEIHRFSSVVPLSGPHCTMSTVQLAGYTIRKETIIIPNIWAVHNDRSLWGDPEVFRPERFLNDVSGKVERPEYLMPFSVGGRKCIGESLVRIELFLFIACLLQKFTFTYATGVAPPPLAAKPSVTRPPQKFSLVIKSRRP